MEKTNQIIYGNTKKSKFRTIYNANRVQNPVSIFFISCEFV
jgi:nucleoid-associated protein YgaU